MIIPRTEGGIEVRIDSVHGEMKELNKSWDFTATVNPLLADQGPALNLVPRIKKQIERLKKLKEDVEHKARDMQQPAAALAQSFYVAEFPNTKKLVKKGKPGKQCKPARTRRPPPAIAIEEALPSWGECKRYSRSMDQSQYSFFVETARELYNSILSYPNPRLWLGRVSILESCLESSSLLHFN
jgi:hypothetical protein